MFEDLQLIYFSCSLDSFISLCNMIALFENFYNILIFSPYCFDSFRNKYKKYMTFLVSQAEYKIFLKNVMNN